MATYCSENYEFSYLDSPDFLIASLHALGCLSIPVHIFGAYCILFITPKNMESVKIAMINYHLLTFLIDLMFSVLVTPYYLAPSVTASLVGVFEKLGIDPILQLCLMVTSVESMFFSIVQILENRYMVICDAHWIWKKIRVPWLVWNYAMVPLFSLPIYLAAPENPLISKSEVLEKFPCLPPEVFELQFYKVNEDLYIAMYTILAFNVLLQCQLVFFADKSRGALKNRGTMSDKTIKLHKKFLRAIAIQILCPVPFITSPLSFFGVEYAFEFYSQKANNIAIAIFSTFGFFSTIIMLFIHSPYRNFILSNVGEFLKFFGAKFESKPATVIVVPSVTSRNLDF